MKRHDKPGFHARSARYFHSLQAEIARDNVVMLRRVSIGFLVFLAVYGVITYFIFHNTLLGLFYAVFFGLGLPFCLFAQWYGRREAARFAVVQGACLLFLLLVVGFTICISVFPFPDRPAIFFPLALMLVAALFILPFSQTCAALSLLTLLFLLLAYRCKNALSLSYDGFGAITAWPLSLLLSRLVLELHVRNGEARLELQRLSATDPLTGLPNRRAMEHSMALRYRQCAQEGAGVAVIMVDLDNFKSFNDALGHAVGDACLTAIGGIFLEFAQAHGCLTARYGGEEFLFLLPGADATRAVDCAEELRARIHACPPPARDCRECVSASLGVAVENPAGADGCDALIRRADAALYQAKGGGKNRVILWEPEG